MITLNALTINGFRAYKTETTFTPTQEAGLKLITGDNKTNRRLGANGAGKSSLWDALVWGLYGTSVKGLRSSDLTSWGGKGIYVKVEFEHGDRPFVVERTSKPPRVSLDGVLCEQADIDRRLGLTKSRFLHSILFGQAARLLPDLTLPERASLFDDIMDTGVWLRASKRAVKRYDDAARIAADAKQDIASIEAQLAELTQSSLAALEEAAEEWEDRCQEELAGARRALLSARRRLGEAQAAMALSAPGVRPPALEKVNRAIAALLTRRDAVLREAFKCRDATQEAAKTIKFYERTKVCDVCQQPISAGFAVEVLNEAKAKQKIAYKASQEAEQDLNKIDADLGIWEYDRDQLLKQVAKTDARAEAAAESLRACQQRVTRAEGVLRDIAEQAAAGNPHDKRLAAAKERVHKLTHQREEATARLADAEKLMAVTDYWRTGFLKVRLFVIKRTLDMLTVDVNNAVSALGLNGWRIEFATETENKSGGSRTGIQIVVRSPTSVAVWEAWSGGEGQRLRVAIAVGFSNLIHRLAGSQYNFEVWDEPSSWLSPEGVEDLLSTLAHRAEQTGKSIWLLDHRSLNAMSFREIWEVKKARTGASIRRVK